MSCAPPFCWAIVEWTVDTDPLVMGDRVRGFLRRDQCFGLFLVLYRKGGLFLPIEFVRCKMDVPNLIHTREHHTSLRAGCVAIDEAR
jgi:hypothetical protein